MSTRLLFSVFVFACAVFGQRKTPELVPTALLKRLREGVSAVAEVRLPPVEEPVRIESLDPQGRPVDTVVGPRGSDSRVFVGVGDASQGAVVGRIRVHLPGGPWEADVRVAAADPGWVMHLNPGFHYDPVWWNTQADYAEHGARLEGHQGPGITLVSEYLAFLEREPAAKAVLHQLPYVKTFLEAQPNRRAELLAAIRAGRMVPVGGSYNEFSSTLIGPEASLRNLASGSRWSEEMLGETSNITWQCDVFGHDPSFPSLIAGAGKTFTAFARGPFHQWGVLHELAGGARGGMNFPSEFWWMGPDGKRVFTHYMPGHYGYAYARLARGRNDAPAFERAETIVGTMFEDLRGMALTRHIMLPMHEDFVRPLRGLGELVDRWNAKWASPTLVIDAPKDFFAAVMKEVEERKIPVPTISRDMNPIYTGCGVSFIDLKLAQRLAETRLRDAEGLSVLAAAGAGGRRGHAHDAASVDRAWRQLNFNAHHDGVTGSMSDQVYIDVMQGYQDALRLAESVRSRAEISLNRTEPPRRPVVADPAFPKSDIEAKAEGGIVLTNGVVSVIVDPSKGGCITSVKDATGREWIKAPADDLLVIEEGNMLPGQGEGPWHLVPRRVLRRISASRAVVEVAAPDRVIVRREDPLFTARTTYRLVPGEAEIQVVQEILGWRGRDTLLRVAYPSAMSGLRPLFETNGAVVGRAFARDVDAFEDPWTLDNVAWRWAALDAPATLVLGARGRELPLTSVAVVEIVVPDAIDAGGMEDVAGWVRVLAGWGVTATVTKASARRYGDLRIDSDRPDLRIALGAPSQNPLVAAAWSGHDPKEVFGSILVNGADGVDILAAGPGTWIPDPKMPRRIVVGADYRSVRQAPPSSGRLALLNRGTPSHHITEDGTLAINLLRSCTGWPSGIWLDEPVRRPPDGSPFEAMHGSHRFDYALRLGEGDGARATFTAAARRFTDAPLRDRPVPTVADYVDVVPPTCEILAVKPPDVPSSMAGVERAEDEIVVRVRNSEPRNILARLTWPIGIATATKTDHRERPESGSALAVDGRTIEIALSPNEIATVRMRLEASYRIAAPTSTRFPSAPWLENLGEGYDGDGAWVVVPSVRELTLENGTATFDVDVANVSASAGGASIRVASLRLVGGDAVAVEPSVIEPFDLARGEVRTTKVKVSRLRPTPGQRIPLRIDAEGPGGRSTATVWIDSPDITKSEPDVTVELDAFAAVGGEVSARIVNRSAAPVEGEVATVAPFRIHGEAAPAPDVVRVQGNGGATVVKRTVSESPGSWMMFTFRGAGKAWYGETVALLPSKDDVAVAFIEDRARLHPGDSAVVTLRLIGMRDGPLADPARAVAAISIDVPGIAARKREPVVEDRGASRRVSLPIELRSSADLAKGVLTATATFGAASLPYVTVPLMGATRASTPPKVDASLDDWEDAAWTRARGRDDARFASKWSEAGMWFAAEVRDGHHRQLKDDGTIWMHDSVQIAVTPEPSSRLGYSGADLEFGVALGPQAPVVWAWYAGDGGTTGKIPTEAAVGRADGVTRYEWFLPASRLLKVKLVEGRRLGFSWIANDDDGEGYAGSTEWSQGMTGGKDSSLFGDLILR